MSLLSTEYVKKNVWKYRAQPFVGELFVTRKRVGTGHLHCFQIEEEKLITKPLYH